MPSCGGIYLSKYNVLFAPGTIRVDTRPLCDFSALRMWHRHENKQCLGPMVALLSDKMASELMEMTWSFLSQYFTILLK
jgi:hypothetical protein